MLYEIDQECLAMISVHVQSGSDTLHSFLPDDSTYMAVLFKCFMEEMWNGKFNCEKFPLYV